MERLAELVRGKSIGILLHGASVGGLREFAAEVDPSAVVWVGLNHFRVLEDSLLRAAGHEMRVVFCCADGEVNRRRDDLLEFIQRPGRRVLITRAEHAAKIALPVSAELGRLITTELPSLWPYPNSLTLLLRMLVRTRPSRIVLFGADGYLGSDDQALPSYFASEVFQRERRLSGVLRDTLLFNAHSPRIFARWREENDSWPEIYNCSSETCLRSMPVIRHDQARAALAGSFVQPIARHRRMLQSLPARADENDPSPELVVCANAACLGDLATARLVALKALSRDPARLSPLAFRALQTDRATMEDAIRILEDVGAQDTTSPHHWRWTEFRSELEASRLAVESWTTWA